MESVENELALYYKSRADFLRLLFSTCVPGVSDLWTPSPRARQRRFAPSWKADNIIRRSQCPTPRV